jgi:putative toxin-antitoxin system antitoxin component (TIGR02293 family)
MAGIFQSLKRMVCSKGPLLNSKQNHGQDSTTTELIRHLAEQVFGNKEKANIWLTQPKTALGGSTPLELSHTEAGYERVKAELERLSHGFAC